MFPAVIGTLRTAIVLSTAIGDRCGPDMAIFTLPPDDPTAARRHILWGQRAVFFRVPLCCDSRVECLQTVFSTGTVAGTIGTAIAPEAFGYGGFPGMPMDALPPDFPAGFGGDMFGRQCAVPCRIPLCGQFGMCPGEPQMRMILQQLAAGNAIAFF